MSKLAKLLAALTASLAFMFAMASPASANADWQPDPWLYCYNTVPGTFWSTDLYGGVIFLAESLSDINGTYCKDLTQNDFGVWIRWRTIDWDEACRQTYDNSWGHFEWEGSAYCGFYQ